MLHYFRFLSCAFLVGMICISSAAIAAPVAGNQLMGASSNLSEKDKRALAEQAGVEVGVQRSGPDQHGEPIPAATVEAFDVELLSAPSSLELSIFERLKAYAGLVDAASDNKADGSKSDAEADRTRRDETRNSKRDDKASSSKSGTARIRDYINPDASLEEAWGDNFGASLRRKVTLEERKRLQTAWNEQENEQVTKVVTSHELLQFGYNLFAGSPNTFEPTTEIPIPPEYVLGPGDELSVQFYGSRDDSLELVVDRNGSIEFPPIGSINVAGQSFIEVKALIAEKISQHIIGATGSVSMGRLRSMRVFVLGDVNNPGSYLVSSLSTISNALFVSGGISKQGSLRHVILKRGGKPVRELDLYDFLLKGDSRNDVRLLPGDVVFVPPIGDVVAVAGEVVRPGIYEFREKRGKRSLADVLKLAGGVQATADSRHIQIDRVASGGNRSLIDVDANKNSNDPVENGDIVLLYPVPDLKSDMVYLRGHVKRPGAFGLKAGMKLSDLISSKDDLLPSTFTDYLIIQRSDPGSGEITILQPPIGKMLADGYRSENVQLQAGDKIFVISNAAVKPNLYVKIEGAVQAPGEYPLGKNMRLTDLLFSAGGPTEEAFLKEAELTRYTVVNGEKRVVKHTPVNITDAIAGNSEANVLLTANDVIMVRSISNWLPSAQIELKGEVKFPGVYTIEAGETIEQVIKRAGGFTEDAYAPAAVFTRESIKEEQKKQLEKAADKLENEIIQLEIANESIVDPGIKERKNKGISSAKVILDKMREAEPQGRLLIDIDSGGKLKGGATLKLVDGDTFYIPKRPDQVLVMGEVYNQSAMLYRKNLDRDDFIKLAGGTTNMADSDRIYIVRASGYVDSGRGWLRNRDIYPGDTIIVPQTLETFNLLDSALDWSKVLMQVAIFTAAMTTVGVF